MMKYILVFCSFLFVLNVSEEKDTQEIVDRLKTYHDSFLTNDVKKIEKFWTEDALLSLPRISEDLEGRREIAEMSLKRFNENPDGKIYVKDLSIKFPEKDKAVQDVWNLKRMVVCTKIVPVN